MLNPNLIRQKSFEYVKNGYDPNSVNHYLNELADTISQLIADNNIKDEKMATLVESINEMREEKDAVTNALVTAQKEAARIVKEAEEKSNEMIESAKTEQVRITEQNAEECERIIKEHKEKCAQLIKENTEETQAKIFAIRRAYDEQKEALKKLKAETTYFKSELTDLYKKQLLLIMDIPEVSDEELAAYEKEEAEKIEAENKAKEEAANEAAKEIEANLEKVEHQERTEHLDEILNTGSFDPIMKTDYNDLKFGKNN
ncbi:MAG: DivIVA domain-containing protein [Oscillospiraceae bacterium]